MSRKNSRKGGPSQRKGRLKGPKALSQAAEHELKEHAEVLVRGLSRATRRNGSVAAASLLLELAEGVELVKGSAKREHVLSLAERWAREPEVCPADTAAALYGVPARLQLTSGTPEGDSGSQSQDARSTEPDDILDAEVE